MGTITELRAGDKAAWKELHKKLENLTEILRDLEEKARELAPYAERYRIITEQIERIRKERDNLVSAALMAVKKR